jgi:hypothetical protein
MTGQAAPLGGTIKGMAVHPRILGTSLGWIIEDSMDDCHHDGTRS